MKTTHIYLPRADATQLGDQAAVAGTSPAGIIRDVVEQYVNGAYPPAVQPDALVKVKIRVPDDLWEEAKRRAEREGVTVTEAMRYATSQYLDAG